jgi:hypothetical protein
MYRWLALLCAWVSLAAASDVTGAWQLTAKLPDGREQNVELSFTRSNGKLTGTIGQGGNVVPVVDLREDGAKLDFRVPDDDGKTYSIHLALSGDTLSGDFSGPDGVSGPCHATRIAAPPPLGPAEDFLAKNNQPLDLADGGRRFSASLIETTGKQIFLLGEGHGMAINGDLDLALLQYLHRTAGVRVYLAEWGYAAGELVNRYVETGDEQLLDFMIREARGSVSWTKEQREFFVKFRDWNLTLPEKDRVRMVGVDIEHQVGIAVWYLNRLAMGRTPPAGIRDAVANLAHMQEAKAADELAASLRDHRQDYSAWMGDRLLDFEVVVTNLQKRYEAYAGRNDGQFELVRERAIYETFLKLQPRLAGVKCYGRWGSAHVAQRGYENRDPFAARLNRPDSPVAGKVVSLWPIYQNSESLYMNGGQYRTRRFSDDTPLLAPLASAAHSPVTLFKLTGAGSPFAQALYHFAPGTGGVTTDYAQYFVLIKNATPTHTADPSAMAEGGRKPLVVKTEPAAESEDIPPGTLELKVSFSEEMRPKSFSFVRSMAGETPKVIGEPVLESDGRTFTVKVKVEAGRVYAVWLNTARFEGFRSVQGEPAAPYLLVFKTREP